MEPKLKFEKIDREYFARRQKISEKVGNVPLFQASDYWPLYVGYANLARYLAISELVKANLNVPGHIAEFGVYKGANLLFIAKLLQLWEPMSWREIHGFDSFEGLNTFTHEDKQATEFQGAYAGSLETLRDMVELHELEDSVVIHKGLIQDTLPMLMEQRPELMFSMVFCDTDLYEPTKVILDEVHSRICKNGVLVFDEWNYERYPGETKAVEEFLAKHGQHYEPLHTGNTRHPTLLLKKIHH